MKILFCVSSVGLGHAVRSVELCNKFERKKDVEVYFLCAEPALSFIKSKKKRIIKESENLISLSQFIEELTENGILRFKITTALKFLRALYKNYKITRKVLERENFDLILCDEFWEIFFFKDNGKIIFLSDVYKFEDKYLRGMSKILIKILNVILKFLYSKFDALFYAECPSSRCLGYPAIYGKREIKLEQKIRKIRKLRKRKVILVLVGGTSTGKDLIEKIVRISDKVNAVFKIICGPRISFGFSCHKGNVEIINFTDDVLEHYLEADLVLCQAGLSTMLEVYTLNKKTIVFPIKNHVEQLENSEKIRSDSIFIADRSITDDELIKIIKNTLEFYDEDKNNKNNKKEKKIKTDGIRNAYKVISWRYLTKQGR